ncbi:MAG: TlpA family protein disulfide reductase [Acidobacteria bacterium]|nr:TlpA family protein disulfide reductase [Acidobacteriota bacterium]
MLSTNDEAPDFELPLLSSLELSRFGSGPTKLNVDHLSRWSLRRDLLGRGPALITFVKENCSTCRFALPFLDRMYRNYPDSKVMLAVVDQDPPEVALSLVQSLSLKIPVLLDLEPYEAGERYDVAFVPTLFYIAQKGAVEKIIEGFAREELREINRQIARVNGLSSPVPFFNDAEGVPFYRPG